MHSSQLGRTDDVSAVWAALQSARELGDDELVRIAQTRLRELAERAEPRDRHVALHGWHRLAARRGLVSLMVGMTAVAIALAALWLSGTELTGGWWGVALGVGALVGWITTLAMPGAMASDDASSHHAGWSYFVGDGG